MNHRIVVFAAACRRRGLQPDTGRAPVHRAEVGDGERQTVPGVDLADAARPSLHRRQHVRGRKRAGGSQLLSQSDQRRRSSLVLHDWSANHPRILRSAQMWSVLAVFHYTRPTGPDATGQSPRTLSETRVPRSSSSSSSSSSCSFIRGWQTRPTQSSGTIWKSDCRSIYTMLDDNENIIVSNKLCPV